MREVTALWIEFCKEYDGASQWQSVFLSCCDIGAMSEYNGGVCLCCVVNGGLSQYGFVVGSPRLCLGWFTCRSVKSQSTVFCIHKREVGVATSCYENIHCVSIHLQLKGALPLLAVVVLALTSACHIQ